MRLFVLNVALLLWGCGYDWHQEGPEMPSREGLASRLDSPGPRACEIGTLYVKGNFDDQWESVARSAARHGGTSYFVHTNYGPAHIETTAVTRRAFGMSFTSADSTVSRDVDNAVTVYREGDGCEEK